MKITGIELEREDLITLFSDGTYDSSLYIHLVGNADEIEKFREEEHDRLNGACREDLWADWLLKGNKLMLDGNDGWEEGEADFDEDLNQEFDLETLKLRMNQALNDEEVKYHVINLINGDDDFYTGYCLLQYIAYGEIVLC